MSCMDRSIRLLGEDYRLIITRRPPPGTTSRFAYIHVDREDNIIFAWERTPVGDFYDLLFHAHLEASRVLRLPLAAVG
jgi:hypothetical protein